MISHYVQPVTWDDEQPSCHVCGAIMTKVGKDWKCLSCGADTAPAESFGSGS